MPEFRMTIPIASSYKDVNSDVQMAPIDAEKAQEYMDRLGVIFDAKIVDLYDEHFLLYLRRSSTDTLDFVHSACRAEMKKKITYSVDTSEKWFCKFVSEAQCECGAGGGGHMTL